MAEVYDHHVFFQHASYGNVEPLNDHNILNLSPINYNLTKKTFEIIENESNAVPFVIGSYFFHLQYIFVDGIYPNLSRFVNSIKQPVSQTVMKITK